MNIFKMLLVWVFVLVVVPSSLAALHPISPCPSVFSYEGSQPEHERWYGVALLSTDESLVGVRIDVKLDRPAEILVSWMGTVTTDDNERFTILSLDQKLLPGPPIPSRFMVKFNPAKGSPQVRTVRLNGRQICPPDPNFATDVQSNGQDHLYENRETTERVTRRPDLDFDDDWTNSRPANPVRNPGNSDTYKPPKGNSPSGNGNTGGTSGYSSHETSSSGGYGSQSVRNPGSSVYNSHESSSSGGFSSQVNRNPGSSSHSGGGSSSTGGHNSQGSRNPSSSSSSSSVYSSQESSSSGGQGSRNPGSGVYSSHVEATVHTYNSHETYGDKNHRPSVTSVSHTYNNTRPSFSGHSSQSNPGLNTDYAQPSDPEPVRPSISININKDVTYNVDRPDALSYNSNDRETNRPSSEREPSHSNNQYSNTELTSSGSREDIYSKSTTKKPVVINSINININSGDSDIPNSGSNYNPPKSTTKRPYVNNSKNSTSNNSPITHRPTSSNNQRPTSSHENTRPNRNPEISSSETHSQNGYGQNVFNNQERTTEKVYNNNKGTSSENFNHKTSSSEFNDYSRPSSTPSSRPNSGGGNKNTPRPQSSSTSKHGEEGDLESTNSRMKCGRVEVNPAPLITHGQNTARGQWPWHIALYRIEGINLSYSCGGSLISSTVVITAAHCVTKAPRDRPVDADILVVQLGKYHLYQFSDDSVQNKQVQNVIVHPKYNSTNYLDDLALLVLSSPAEFTKFVRPVCLWPRHNFNLPSINNKEGTVVGWGYDENNQVTEELKMARMPVVSYVTCLKSYPQFFSQFTAENKTFCAGFRQGTSVCNGDSGGGMVFQQDNVWYLRGLVSITVAKQGLRVCDTNHYVVFTDIANYIDWIKEYM